MDEQPGNTPQENFESLWQTVDKKYSFFELKNINWDSVHAYYAPQVNPTTSDMKLFSILDSMLYDLRDGHVNLISPFDLSRNWQWYLGHPDNFDSEVVERFYLGPDHRIAGGIKYTIIDSVGYLYYGSFSSGFSVANLNEVMAYFKNTKGLIVDVRSNGGGSLGNAFALAQRLISSSKQALITREKSGPGPDDFGNTFSYTLKPSEGVNYQGPVAVLTNRRSYSATNTFAGMLSVFDNVTLIGDRTGGGGGIPIDYELPNGWRYRFSATQSFIPVGNGQVFNIELGVPPDIEASTNAARLILGKDDIIETALDFLK